MPATIKQNLDAIKEAVYGEEVRTAIHDSIEQCYEDTSKGKTLAEGAADRANEAASNADTARRNAQAVVDGAVTAINDAASQQRQSVNDLGNQLKSYLSEHYSETITKAEAKANRSSVSTVKHAIGADGKLTLTDALNEPAKKMTIHLEPKQDLHGYDHPWIGGTGKNLLPPIGNTETWAVNANSTYTATDEQLTIVMTNDVSSGVYSKGGSDIRNVIAGLNGVYTWSIDLKADKSVRIVTGIQDVSTLTVSVGTDWQRFSGTGTFTDTSNPFVIYNNGGSGTATTVYARNIMIESGSSATSYEPYSNICPIEGFDTVGIASAGKNLLPQFGEKWVNGYTANWIACVKSGNAPTYPFTFVTSGEGAYTNVPVCAILCFPNTEYTITPPVNMKAVVTEYKTIADVTDSNKAIKTWQSTGTGYKVGPITRTTAVNAHALVVAFSNWNGSASITLQKNEEFQLELGQAATAYEPYYGDSISLNLVSSAGSTVYGGTVTVNEDGSGTLVVDRGRVTIDNFLNLSSGTQPNGLHWSDTTQNVFNINVNAESICSMLADRKDGNVGWGSKTECFAIGTTGLRIYTTETTNDAFREKYKDVKITYGFNTPLVYQLTATQLQTFVSMNHIWTDGTSIELDYYSDKYGLVDRLISAFPKDTATGNPAIFTDGADDLPVEKLEVAIEPKQDLHGYDNPWVGGAGKNLLDLTSVTVTKTDSGITATPNGDGTFNLSGTASSNTINIWLAGAYGSSASTIFTLPAGTYTVYDCVLFKGTAGVGGGSTYAAIHAPQKITSTSPIEVSGVRVSNLTSGQNYNGSILQPAIYAGEYNSGNLPSWEPYSNICPITGWDTIWLGENMYNKNNVLLGKNWIKQPSPNRATIFFDIEKGVQYQYRIQYKGNKNLGIVYGENSAIGQAQTFSWNIGMSVSTMNDHITTNTKAFIQFQWNDGGKTDTITQADIDDFEIVICKGDIATYSQTIPVKSISGSTVYGGKLVMNRDGTGELVVDRAVTTLADKTFGDKQSSTLAAGGYIPITGFTSRIDASTAIKSDMLVGTTFNNRGANGSISPAADASSVSSLVLFTTKTKDEAVAAYKNATICYKLVTTATYPLTAPQITTLLGSNHISCDAGEVTVTYHADPTLFITKKIAQALNA